MVVCRESQSTGDYLVTSEGCGGVVAIYCIITTRAMHTHRFSYDPSSFLHVCMCRLMTTNNSQRAESRVKKKNPKPNGAVSVVSFEAFLLRAVWDICSKTNPRAFRALLSALRTTIPWGTRYVATRPFYSGNNGLSTIKFSGCMLVCALGMM